MKSMCPIRKVPSHDHKLKLDFKPQKPKFERELYPEYVKPLGTPVTLEVIARGRPKPTFTWYFNSTKIRVGSSTKYIVTVLNDRCMLQILELSKDTEGLYTCRAVNEHGESTTTTRITIGEYEEMVTPSPIDSIGQRPQEDVVSSIRSDEYVEHYTPALGEQLQRPTEITADDFVMLHYTVGTTQTTDTATTVTQRTATSREDITGMNQRGPQLPQAAKPGSPIPSRVQYMPGPISGFAQEEIPQLQPQPTTKTMIEQAREYLIKMIPKPVWQFSMWSADQSNVCQPGEAIEKPAHPVPAWSREAIQPRLPGEEIPQAPQYPTVRDADQRSQTLFPGQELPSYLQTAALRQPQPSRPLRPGEMLPQVPMSPILVRQPGVPGIQMITPQFATERQPRAPQHPAYIRPGHPSYRPVFAVATTQPRPQKPDEYFVPAEQPQYPEVNYII